MFAVTVLTLYLQFTIEKVVVEEEEVGLPHKCTTLKCAALKYVNGRVRF